MTEPLPHQILAPEDGPVAELVNPNMAAPICLVCEHASPMIPPALGNLGMAEADLLSHAAWDPGAADLARALSRKLDAPLLLARVSRLVQDCNRLPDRADAMPERVESIEIPGNSSLCTAARAARTAEIYDPFHSLLSATLDGFQAPPALVTIHSFTPTWLGTYRSTEIGLLHDSNDRMARAMLAAAASELNIALNRPYSAADGVTHMLARHATARGLDNVMIEVRNDLLTSDTDIARIADIVHPMLLAALNQVSTE